MAVSILMPSKMYPNWDFWYDLETPIEFLYLVEGLRMIVVGLK
jgi:hypothetical protein